MLADLRYAFRQVRRSPGFAITAILTLALGIGANTAIFSLIDSILLQPLPFAQQERLMRIDYGGSQAEVSTSFFPKGWVRALNEHSSSFAAISAFGPNAESNVGEGSPARVFGAEVMTNALGTLGLHPAAGRFFTAEDGITGHEPVVVLSYGYWREHYDASPAAIGQTVRIDGVSRQIVGVMPAGVRFPYADTRFLVPVTFKGGDPLDPWETSYDLRMFGRLKDGATPGQAQAELRELHNAILPLFPWRMPDTWASQMTVIPLLEAQVGAMRPRLLLLFAAVGLILLIACANVANLTLARAAGREREMAIRGALGATGGRLVRQLLSESALLGLLAGGVGLFAASGSIRLLVRWLPADTPRLQDVTLGWPVYAFAALASLAAGILFGVIPALKMARPKLESLHSGSRSVAGRVGQFRVSMLLVMGQIALSVLVITGAGLLLHSLWRLSQVDPGFRTDRVMTAEISLDASACQAKGHCAAFFQALLDRMRGMSGAEHVALADSVPLTAEAGNYVYDAEGHPRAPRQGALLATGRTVTPEYFATIGLTLVRGRLLNDEDLSGASRAAVINQRMAERLWPGQDPVGKHLQSVTDEPQPAVWAPDKAVTVVGVVNNTHENGLASDFGEEVYLPPTPAREQPVLYVLLRTRAETQAAADELRSEVAAVGSQVAVTRVRTLNEVVAASVSAPRSLAVLLLVFGALALAIGGVGVYSLIACIVSWRTREIGIRLALGAQRRQIVEAIVRQSLMLALGGSAAGLIAALFTGQLLRRFLFDVHALDPLTFASVALLMTLLALVAAWIPARRAASVDPIKTLRME